MNYCNEIIHNVLSKEDTLICLFCDVVLKKPDAPKTILCCEKPVMIIDNGPHICKSCGSVNGYQVVREFVDFYENTYRIKKNKFMRQNIT